MATVVGAQAKALKSRNLTLIQRFKYISLVQNFSSPPKPASFHLLYRTFVVVVCFHFVCNLQLYLQGGDLLRVYNSILETYSFQWRFTFLNSGTISLPQANIQGLGIYVKNFLFAVFKIQIIQVPLSTLHGVGIKEALEWEPEWVGPNPSLDSNKLPYLLLYQN